MPKIRALDILFSIEHFTVLGKSKDGWGIFTSET
jgi:hypothetical protein